MVLCSNMRPYICKYMQNSLAAPKLVCEVIGHSFANEWRLNIPEAALVYIRDYHWRGIGVSHVNNTPSFGSRFIENVVDISSSTFFEIPPLRSILKNLLEIALFDFWSANEDRNINNSNLLYDINSFKIIAIDFGCIFNTATFEFPLSQLTMTDTILYSDLYHHIVSHHDKKTLNRLIKDIRKDYFVKLENSKGMSRMLLSQIPSNWGMKKEIIEEKINQLFMSQWVKDVWENFIENIEENA